ncbi:LysE family translocator [Amphritea atlantica]|uniref:LysE family translocator n=1 Tax=Amphritea atlantica TaxID=355243 RepID=A0ABY5H085_9GAMM|nr:LysE family translocator [Amphritea atlantica]
MNVSMILSMSVFALAASASPGPVNLVCLSSGSQHPITKGLAFVTGATLGFIFLFFAVGMGLLSVLEQIPALTGLLRWSGILFLLYLSIKLALYDGQLADTQSGRPPGFMTGALMQWLNPKAWLASASGIGAYTSGNNIAEIIIFAALYLPICWLSLGSWVYAGVFLRRYITQPSILRSINRTLAALLMSSCIYLLFD